VDRIHHVADSVQGHPPLLRQGSLVNHIDVSVDPLDGAHGYLASRPGFGLGATYASGNEWRTAQRMICIAG
jgi:hypothetical protein